MNANVISDAFADGIRFKRISQEHGERYLKSGIARLHFNLLTKKSSRDVFLKTLDKELDATLPGCVVNINSLVCSAE